MVLWLNLILEDGFLCVGSVQMSQPLSSLPRQDELPLLISNLFEKLVSHSCLGFVKYLVYSQVLHLSIERSGHC